MENINDKIRLTIARRIGELTKELNDLSDLVINENDVYYKASWFDPYYPNSPSNDCQTKTLEESINWLSKESHPMGFSNCYMSIGMYVKMLNDEVLLESFDAERLARLKRASMNIPE